MDTKKGPLKGDALVNKVVLIVMEIINTALIFGYISDFLTGTSTLLYFVIFEIAAISTFFLVPIAYKLWPVKMKYIALVCFAVVYTIGCMGAHVDVAFVMVFPIAVIFVLYYDYKLIRILTMVFGVVCTLDILVILFVLKRLHSGVEINSSVLLMEFLGTIIFLIAVRVVTKISIQNNNEKIETIQAVAEKVNASIKNINVEIVQLDESAKVVKNAMEEINSGVGNAAEAVQHQLVQTEAIQDRIESVQAAAGSISDNIASTLSSVEAGNREVTTLVSQADTSVEISNKVTKDLSELRERVEAMRSITKIIENIAFQTNIMALNANVEAARAGEAGLGFAVVATEISNMSAKTKQATDDIAELISNAEKSLKELMQSIEEMSAVILSEKTQTTQTTEVFSDIQKSTVEVREYLNQFMQYISGLTEANREIVQSVQTISAATEQVNALTNEAMNMEGNNAMAVQSIAKQVGELANTQ